MAKQIRKVFRRSYDKCIASDYIGDVDNLNPKRNTELETQVNEIVNECRARLNKIEKKYNLEDEISNFTVRSSSLDDMQKEIDALLKKLNNNPAKRLYDMGLNPTNLMGDDAFNDLNSPLTMDCYGVETVGNSSVGKLVINYSGSEEEENSESESADAEAEGLSDDELDKVYNITYHLDGANDPAKPVSQWPKTYTMRHINFILYSEITYPVGSDGKNYEFGGWYLDSSYNQKIKKNIFKGYSKDVDLYAYKYCPDDEDGDEGDDDILEEENPAELVDQDETSCAIKELEWLKIILVIVAVIKILLVIVTTVLGIIVPLMNIIKEAQLAWINPPLMASIIERVSQKLMALVFSIIGTLLMKLWSLLNFDCISGTASEVLAEINQILSGVLGVMGSVDELACAGQDSASFDWSQFAEDTKNNLSNQWQQFKDSWSPENMAKQFGAAWGQACGEWEEVFTDPKKLYNAAVPAEIRDKISGLISQYQECSDTVQQIAQTYNNIGKSALGEKPEKTVRGSRSSQMSTTNVVDPNTVTEVNKEPTETTVDASQNAASQSKMDKAIQALKETAASTEE